MKNLYFTDEELMTIFCNLKTRRDQIAKQIEEGDSTEFYQNELRRLNSILINCRNNIKELW